MKLSRRDLAALLPLVAAQAASAQTPSPQAKVAKAKLTSKVYAFEALPVKQNGANSSRAVMNGLTHDSVPFEMHITELGPGMAPHPPHQHVHEEITVIREGTLDVTMNGVSSKAGPGAVIYAASGDMHGWVNNTDKKALYYVIAVGHE